MAPKSNRLNRVRRAQRRGGLRLALEPAQQRLRVGVAARAQDLRAHQLDGRLPRQQLVLGAPHLAHAAAPQQLHQVVAAERLGVAQLAAQPVQHARRQHRDRRAGVVGPHHHENLGGRWRGDPAQVGEPERQRIERRGDQRREQHAPRRVRRHHRVDEDEDRGPGEVRRRHGGWRRNRPGVQGGDPGGVGQHDDDADVGLALAAGIGCRRVQPHHERDQRAHELERQGPPVAWHARGVRQHEQVHDEPDRPHRRADQAEQRQPLHLLREQFFGQERLGVAHTGGRRSRLTAGADASCAQPCAQAPSSPPAGAPAAAGAPRG